MADMDIRDEIKLSDYEFRLISALVYEKLGIVLSEKKRALVNGRLQNLIKKKGLKSFKAYYKLVTSDITGASLQELADRITTNHTFFWRESDHFVYLYKNVLPEIVSVLKKNRKTDLRVWCAACSTGEEPYTLVMMIRNFLGNDHVKWDYTLLATDISIKVLLKAGEGVYSKERVDKLPAALLSRYFKKISANSYRVNDEIRDKVLFKKLNLLDDSYPFKGKFHIIFCRNVMIYFDQVTRENLIDKLARVLHPGGYLFIGHSETLGRSHKHFKYIQPAIYVRR